MSNEDLIRRAREWAGGDLDTYSVMLRDLATALEEAERRAAANAALAQELNERVMAAEARVPMIRREKDWGFGDDDFPLVRVDAREARASVAHSGVVIAHAEFDDEGAPQ